MRFPYLVRAPLVMQRQDACSFARFVGEDIWTEACEDLGLSYRQRDVLAQFLEGKTLKEAARDLRMPIDTVRTHDRRMRRKLGADTRVFLVTRVFRTILRLRGKQRRGPAQRSRLERQE